MSETVYHMARSRCDRCGEKFNSPYNLKLHKQMDVCVNENEAEKSSQSTEPEPDPEPRRELLETEITGVVIEYNNDRGFGFVSTADYFDERLDGTAYTADAFIHITEVDSNRLSSGDRIRFDLVDTEKGYTAEHATVIERVQNREAVEPPKREVSKRPNSGQGVDDTQYRPELKSKSTESDIESFRDERKFR